MIRNKVKELTPLLSSLKTDLKNLDILLPKEPEESYRNYWIITHSIVQGFNICGEKPDDWSHIIGSSAAVIFNYLNDHKLTDVSPALIGSIKDTCEKIFFEVYGYRIKDEKNMPDMISFFLDKSRRKKSTVAAVCLILSMIVVSLSSLLHWYCYGQPHFKFDGAWYDHAAPMLLFLFIALFFTDEIKGWLSKIILQSSWKIHWHTKRRLSWIRHWFDRFCKRFT